MAAVGLILTAFSMKAGEHKFWRLHYITGLLAGGVGIAAFSAAIAAVVRRWFDSAGHPNLPLVANVHLVLATLGLLALSVQVALGLAVQHVMGGPPRYLRYHRRNGRVLVVLAVGILLLGLATVSALMV
jgi:hypothetical protein